MRVGVVLVFIVLTGWVIGQGNLKISLGKSTFDAREIVINREIPWDLVMAPDGALWFTEKKGTINRVDPESNEVKQIGKIGEVYVSPKENAGMHSMCFHPQWPDSNFIFVHYVNSASTSRLVKMEIDLEEERIRAGRVLFDNLPAARSHNGSRMTIDVSGNILFSLGDAYLFDPAQDLNQKSGKILRFTPDGEVPEGNPFSDSYVWSYGHRNPQGLVAGSNGVIYASEHGPTTDDEINVIYKGKNYGWPKVNGFCDLASEEKFCSENDVVEPIWAFTPTAAPSGLTYYDRSYFPELSNHLLQCFLKGKALCALKLNEEGTEVEDIVNYFENDYFRLRDVEIAPDGSLYLATSNHEKSTPPTMKNDDKIIHVRRLEDELFRDLDVRKNKINVACHNTIHTGKLKITTFYGGMLREVELTAEGNSELEYIFEKPGIYWLKYVSEERIVSRLIRVNDLNKKK